MGRRFLFVEQDGQIYESADLVSEPSLEEVQAAHPGAIIFEVDEDTHENIKREQEYYRVNEKGEVKSRNRTDRVMIDTQKRDWAKNNDPRKIREELMAMEERQKNSAIGRR